MREKRERKEIKHLHRKRIIHGITEMPRRPRVQWFWNWEGHTKPPGICGSGGFDATGPAQLSSCIANKPPREAGAAGSRPHPEQPGPSNCVSDHGAPSFLGPSQFTGSSQQVGTQGSPALGSRLESTEAIW